MTARTARARQRALALLIAVLPVVACGDGDDDDAGDGGHDVTSTVVSHESTQDVLVFSPDAEGPWPVVFALHGIDGSADQLAELGRRLASEGTVVFAPTYRTDLRTEAGQIDLARDVECGYRFARSIAGDHGGDLDQPVTFLGWSLGATLAIQGGLDEEIDPSGAFLSCFTEVPRADVVVSVSGCHDEVPANLFSAADWTNDDVDIVLAAGDEDTTCPASQSEHAATALRAAGYDVDLVTLEGADHFAPVFSELVDGEMVPAADDRIGEQVVELVIDAIAARQQGG